MILRPFDPQANDEARLVAFRCSTGPPFEADVEQWIRHRALAWVNDVPRAMFQRRELAMVEDDRRSLVAVVAWQDIVRVDLEGIWLEVLAVGIDHQHDGRGRVVYELTIDRLQTVERDGDHLAGLVHIENSRSKRLLTSAGWAHVATWDDHELWTAICEGPPRTRMQS